MMGGRNRCVLVLAGCFMLLAGSAGTVIAAVADEAVDLARRVLLPAGDDIARRRPSRLNRRFGGRISRH